MDIFAEAETQLREASSKKIPVEVTLLKAIEARNAVSLEAVLDQLRKLRQEQSSDVVSIPAPAQSSAPAPGPKPFRAEMAPVPTGAQASSPQGVLHEGSAPGLPDSARQTF